MTSVIDGSDVRYDDRYRPDHDMEYLNEVGRPTCERLSLDLAHRQTRNIDSDRQRTDRQTDAELLTPT